MEDLRSLMNQPLMLKTLAELTDDGAIFLGALLSFSRSSGRILFFFKQRHLSRNILDSIWHRRCWRRCSGFFHGHLKPITEGVWWWMQANCQKGVSKTKHFEWCHCNKLFSLRSAIVTSNGQRHKIWKKKSRKIILVDENFLVTFIIKNKQWIVTLE